MLVVGYARHGSRRKSMSLPIFITFHRYQIRYYVQTPDKTRYIFHDKTGTQDAVLISSKEIQNAVDVITTGSASKGITDVPTYNKNNFDLLLLC